MVKPHKRTPILLLRSSGLRSIFPFLLLGGFALWANTFPQSYEAFADKEGPVEWLSFLFLLVGLLAFFLISVQTRGKTWEFLVSLCFTGFILVIAMEEISWGQKIFYWETPEFWRNINYQHETTLHNLNPIQDSILLHFLFVLLGCAVCLYDQWIRIFRRKTQDLYTACKRFSPTTEVKSYFLIVGLYYFYVEFLSDPLTDAEIPYADLVRVSQQETVEVLIGAGFAVYGGMLLKRFNTFKRT